MLNEPNIKFFNPYENTLNKAFINYDNTFQKPSPTSQISGMFLYNQMNNDKKDYGGSQNVMIKPIRTYDSVGGSMNK
jgi:hypothetical protein